MTCDSGPRNGTRPSMPSGTSLSSDEHVVLEVAVLGVATCAAAAALHRAERAHAAVALELLAVDEDQLARRLGGAGQQRAEHRGRRARGQRLGDVAGELQPTVGDHRHPGRRAGGDGLEDRGDLRCADTGDHAGGADRAGPDTDLDRVRTGLDQRRGAPPRVATLPPTTWTRSPTSALSRLTISSTPRLCAWAVSTMSTSTPASASVIARVQASSPTPTAAPTSSRPSRSLVA